MNILPLGFIRIYREHVGGTFWALGQVTIARLFLSMAKWSGVSPGNAAGIPNLIGQSCVHQKSRTPISARAGCNLEFKKKTKPDHSSSLAKATHIHSPDSLSVVAVVPECQHDRQVLPCSTLPKEAFVPRSFFRFVPHCWVGGARIYLPGLWRGTLHKNRAPLVQRNHF